MELTQGHRIDFALDLDSAVLAPKNIDCLVKLGFFENQTSFIFMVLLQAMRTIPRSEQ